MKITNEKGSAAVKILIVAIIGILIGGAIGAFFLIKGKKSNNVGNTEEQSKKVEELTYVETVDKEDVYIGSNGKVYKINNELTVGKDKIYKNCVLVEDEEENRYLMDANGKKITEPGQYKDIRTIEYSQNYALFQVANEDYKYGVINEKGELIVPCENSEYFEKIAGGYFYTHNFVEKSGEYKYEYSFYDETGKKVYSKIMDRSDLYVPYGNIVTLRNGAVIALIRLKDNEQYELVNLSTGEMVEDIKINEKYNMDLTRYGNMVYLELYEGSRYSEQSNMVRMCYWFGDDKKLIKSQQLQEKEYINTRNKEDAGCVIISGENECKAYKDGEVIFTDKYSITAYEMYNKNSNSYSAFFVKNPSKRNYEVYNEKNEKILDQYISSVGNKYLQGKGTLYNTDGTVAKENVLDYNHDTDIDFIKTEDGITMECGDNSKTIDADIFSADRIRNIDDNYVAVEFKEKAFIINKNTLSYCEIDAEGGTSYWLYGAGYVNYGNKYYDCDGKQIYETSKK